MPIYTDKELAKAIKKLENNSLMNKAMDQTDSFMQYKPIGSNYSVGDMTKFGLNVVPFVGDAMAIGDAKTEYNKGNYGRAAINAATALPMIGDTAAAAKVAIPSLAGLGGLVAAMARRTGDVPITPFIRQAGILGGKGAKTADLSMLDRAMKMAEKGAKREDIWNQTGWFKGVDGKWKFEIDDSSNVFRSKTMNTISPNDFGDTNLNQYLTKSDTLTAYPSTRNIKIRTKTGGGGAYIEGGPDPLMPSAIDDEMIKIGIQSPSKQRESMTLHELQHAVQNREGFARGGSPEDFMSQADAERARDAKIWIDELREMKTKYPKADMIALENRVVKSYQDSGMMDYLPDREARDLGRSLFYNDEGIGRLKQLMEDYGLNKRVLPYSPAEGYKRLAGEAEARAVQNRMNLTIPERAKRPFWLDYDVPEKDQIVRFK